ncbi:hypothetical protein FHU34_111865 [Micromonospora taraxaci]|uniref:Uncharacterized protein n=1 Tax=Micromonospora taraxaci TaxID=1316803 RepID=A0A561VY27_9ACTN|nr:hypothetical protein FHU34_111865 [Micromonospora taraxaci]
MNPNPRGIYYVLEFGFLWLIFLAGVESYALSIVGNYDFQLNPLANKWRMSLKSDPARFARTAIDVGVLVAFTFPALLGKIRYVGLVEQDDSSAAERASDARQRRLIRIQILYGLVIYFFVRYSLSD